MCPEWYGIASALYQAFQDMVYARLGSFHWFGCCILSDGGKASLGDQMSYKFYFLKLLITSLITPLLASFICAFPVMLLLDTEITLLNLLLGVGLGYISLGQQSTTLSGGEAQRIKLATELSKRDTGNTFYILDEPTTGLHFEDVRILMDVLNRLTDKGNTMLIIEHNLDVIKMADHIIDIGYEGGRNGGQLVAKGTPEEVAKDKKSFTAKFLRNELN